MCCEIKTVLSTCQTRCIGDVCTFPIKQCRCSKSATQQASCDFPLQPCPRGLRFTRQVRRREPRTKARAEEGSLQAPVMGGVGGSNSEKRKKLGRSVTFSGTSSAAARNEELKPEASRPSDNNLPANNEQSEEHNTASGHSRGEPLYPAAALNFACALQAVLGSSQAVRDISLSSAHVVCVLS